MVTAIGLLVLQFLPESLVNFESKNTEVESWVFRALPIAPWSLQPSGDRPASAVGGTNRCDSYSSVPRCAKVKTTLANLVWWYLETFKALSVPTTIPVKINIQVYLCTYLYLYLHFLSISISLTISLSISIS